MAIRFEHGARDPSTRARRGVLHTVRGKVETPAFMPVGTRATVTGLTPRELRELGAEIVLGNTYHLLLRPGPEAMRHFGGLHRFMGWDRPILTDSGGFQIFSLPGHRTVTEEGARFQSYVDSSYHALSPERSMEVQAALGSDVAMVLDVCVPSTAEPEEIRAAMDRTHRWALRSLAARSPEQALFAIVQGGLSLELRAESARFLTGHPFDGFAIGGLAVGDTRSQRRDVVAATADLLPDDRPRYLMGVGTPPDILEAVGRGVDLFDCVIPTSLAWQGTAFTSAGRVRLTRTECRLSDARLDDACGCETCRNHSRGYLHHLMRCKEPLGPRLLSLHNLRHYLDLMRGIREAIDRGAYARFMTDTLRALDRHEHDPSRRPPGRRSTADVGAAPPRFEVVTTREGAPAVLDHAAGEIMHPVIGAAAEAEKLYVAQSRLAERLAAGGPPLLLLDVGLGAGSNALAAIRAARVAGPGARPLELRSLERDTSALGFAASAEGAAGLGLPAVDVAALRALLDAGVHGEPGATWRLTVGDALQTLGGMATGASAPGRERGQAGPGAEVVFWDPFSPKANPELWTVRAFSTLRAACAASAVAFTYSTSTAVRSALLLAGFFVGFGDASGPKTQTTAASTRLDELARPLDRRWLERLARSSAPLPPDAPPDALDRIRAHPQFA